MSNNLSVLSLPVSSNFHIVSPTKKNISSTPYLVKTLQKGFGRKDANLSILDHPLPNHLGIHIDVFFFKFMPLFLVKHIVFVLNPYFLNIDATMKMPNLNILTKYIYIYNTKKQ